MFYLVPFTDGGEGICGRLGGRVDRDSGSGGGSGVGRGDGRVTCRLGLRRRGRNRCRLSRYSGRRLRVLDGARLRWLLNGVRRLLLLVDFRRPRQI